VFGALKACYTSPCCLAHLQLSKDGSRTYSTRHGHFFVASMSAVATVGTPVTQRPPCSPGRAVFPHPVPRLHALPRRVKPCLLWPAGRVAHTAPVRHVRDECPVRAACFRRVLPHVGGFPH